MHLRPTDRRAIPRRDGLAGLRAVRAGRRRLVPLALAATLAVLSTAVMSSAAAAQTQSGGSDVVRIVARKLIDDRLEFGFQQQENGSWGERRLPRLRFFPADATIDRWLQSSPLTVRVAATAGSSATDVEVRIVARQLANGKVEFALRKLLADGSWSGTLLPSARMFPTTATLGSWLSSTPISVLTTQPSTSTSTSSTSRPVRFTALDAGSFHTCGLRSDNTIDCWGENEHGQADAPRASYRAVSTGDSHTCAIRSDGTATCWGWNSSGQVVAPAGRFTAVTSGRWHSCGLQTDRTIACWGDDFYRERSDVPSGEFSSVTAGRYHTCALRSDGSIACWGRNPDADHGQATPPGGEFSAISAGDLHTCGLRTNGTITVSSTRRAVSSPPSARAGTTDAACAPMAPPPAGASTTTARPMRRAAGSPPLSRVWHIRAGWAPMAP